jgi:hypothetical protein
VAGVGKYVATIAGDELPALILPGIHAIPCSPFRQITPRVSECGVHALSLC